MTYVQDWLAGYPDTTRATYGQILADFEALIGTEVHEADQEAMIAYRRAINEQASATVAKKLAAFRSYFTYLILRGVRLDNPALILRKPKVDRIQTVEYLTVEEVQKVMNSFTDSPKDIRDRAIIGVFLHGLRLAEVVGLNVEDFREGDLRVIGKGNKMRLVPLGPTTQQHLREYMRRRKSGPMFLSVYEKDRVERRAVRNVVYEVTERVGAKTHPHALRHTCGTHMMRKTGNLAAVQEILGHADPKTTRVYAHLDTSDLRRAVEQSDLLGEQTGLRLVEEVA